MNIFYAITELKILSFLNEQLRLTVVDTPGFGDGLEGNGSWKACVKYVDDQFAAYFDGESGITIFPI